MFEEAFEDAPVIDAPVMADPVVAADEPALVDLAGAPTGAEVSTPAFSTSATPEAALDDPIEPPAAVSDTEDRVLLQFAATVPHDLAELRRIAADNQW
jgi:hypothetical protein